MKIKKQYTVQKVPLDLCYKIFDIWLHKKSK